MCILCENEKGDVIFSAPTGTGRPGLCDPTRLKSSGRV
jgi:hypothetical protein